MTHLQRLIAGAVLVAGLSGMTARAADPDKLLPASSEMVLQINVRQVLDSDLTKKYALEQLKQILDGNAAKKVLGELGLDPLKDIDQLIVSGSGSNKQDVKGLIIVHGKFDKEKLFKAAEAQTKREPDKFAKVTEDDVTMYKFVPDNADQSLYVSILDERTIVASNDKKMVVEASKANEGNSAVKIKADLANILRKIDGKSSIYAAALLKGKLDEVKLPNGGNLPIDTSAFQDLLPKIEALSLVVQVKADVTMEVTVGMKNEAAATDFQTALDEFLKQIKPLVQIAGAAEPRAKPLVDVLGTIKTSTKSKDVIIVGKVTGAMIGKIVNPDD